MGRKSRYDHFMENAKCDGRLEFDVTNINYSGYGYGKQYAGMAHLYGYDGDHYFEYIVTSHRCTQIIRRLKNKTWWDIPYEIRENYTHNGYLTRVGIDRAMASMERRNRIGRISDSHSRYGWMGGQDGHDMRVRFRNTL